VADGRLQRLKSKKNR